MGSEVVFYFDVAHVHECLLYGVNAACPGACHNDIGAYSCTCPIGYGSVEEDGKPVCGLVVCGGARSHICAFAAILARYLLATVYPSRDGGHTVEEEVYECTHAVDCEL